jgi:flagellar hook-length control protein FliK
MQVVQEGENMFRDSGENPGNPLKRAFAIEDILSSNSKGNIDNVNTFDNNQVIVENSFSNTQTVETQKLSGIISEKADVNILRENSDNDISTQISKQITESIQNTTIRQDGEKQITVRLNPPELGSVIIKFSEKNSELTGALEVSKSQTKYEIEQALPEIIRSLSESGIQLRKIDVVSSESKLENSDSLKDQLMQNENSNDTTHDGSGNQNDRAGDFDKSGFQQWFSNTIEYSRGYSPYNQFASAGSINIMV